MARNSRSLTLSMRTPGGEVIGGRWSRSAIDGSLTKSLAADDVAVFDCGMAPVRPMMLCGWKPRMQSLTAQGQLPKISSRELDDRLRIR